MPPFGSGGEFATTHGAATGAQGPQGTQGHQGTQGNQGAQGGGGGGGAGAPTVRKFPFAHNTPGILTGAALYTPTVNDVLLDAWIEIDTAWDGTTPQGDYGTFSPGPAGLINAALNSITSAMDMTEADAPSSGGSASLLGGSGLTDLAQLATIFNLGISGYLQATGAVAPFPVGYATSRSAGLGGRLVPVKFTTTDPIKVCVSQDGTTTGADPGSTQGAAILYLVTATPV